MKKLIDALLHPLVEFWGSVCAVCRWLFTNVESTVLDDALPFQNEIDAIVEERPPHFMRWTQYLIMVLFLALILIAWLIKVDVVITAQGRINTETPPIVLQPLEQGIIRKLNVRTGDTVKKGQVLATLDPTFAEADMGALSVQEKSVQAQLRRAEAEMSGAPYEAPSAQAGANELIQYQIYLQRKTQYESRLRVFDEQVRQLDSQIRTVQEDEEMLSKQLQITKDVEKMRAELMRSQTGSKLQFLDAQNTRIRLEREYQDSGNRLIGLQHELQQRKAERQTFIDEWRRQTTETVAQTRTELQRLQENLSKATRLNDLVVIAAPEDGVVLDVAKRSVGSVIRAAEPMVTIVPDNAKLVADIVIASRDVGYTQPGQDVVVKVDAFPYQRHGLLEGQLLWISEDSTQTNAALGMDAANPMRGGGDGGGAVHRGRVELTSTKMTNLPPGAHLFPGMTMTAEIKIDRRSVLGFFLTPITKGLTESIREP
ncbi:MAG TPA: HlyD family type I secretion periplasmic adaptor subunit [Candidatus Sulfotelmatobacter sp.]|jgi:HlyD family secretion protein|nr:HlyD family type I secretion periplasmic adaptor subunit [Candidatus Sulfotelmatobacter sp.]